MLCKEYDSIILIQQLEVELLSYGLRKAFPCSFPIGRSLISDLMVHWEYDLQLVGLESITF